VNPLDPAPTAEPKGDAVAALAYGWRTFRANVRPMLVVVVVPLVAQLVLAVAGRVLIHSVARWFLFQIVGIVVAAIAGIGVPRMALMISAGEPPAIGRAFRSERLVAWVVFSAVFGLAEGVGLVLCVIPGLLFLAFFGLAPYFFLDRGLGLGEALRASRAAVTGNGLAFAVLVAIVVGVLGAVVFVVGALVTQAVAALALAYLYRHVTGDPVAG
jgi:uncharacterized membrane protein